MAIVGFNFTKINVEKKAPRSGKIDVSNNVSIKDVIEAEVSVGENQQKAVRFLFQFETTYEPKIGSIVIDGEVLYMQESAKVTEIVSKWKKNKNIEKEIMGAILNNVLSKCNIQALILSQDVNLPSPIPLPKVKMEGLDK